MFLFTFNPMGFLKALFGENKKKPFTGTCEFMDDCPDIAKLRDESNGRKK